MKYVLGLSLILISASLIGCSFQNKESEKKAVCKELKARIVFTGATGDQRVARQQYSEIDKLNTAYRDEECE